MVNFSTVVGQTIKSFTQPRAQLFYGAEPSVDVPPGILASALRQTGLKKLGCSMPYLVIVEKAFGVLRQITQPHSRMPVRLAISKRGGRCVGILENDVDLAFTQRERQCAVQLATYLGPVIQQGISLEKQVNIAAHAVVQRRGAKYADARVNTQHPLRGLAYSLDLTSCNTVSSGLR